MERLENSYNRYKCNTYYDVWFIYRMVWTCRCRFRNGKGINWKQTYKLYHILFGKYFLKHILLNLT